jgi:PKD repeat protein
VRNRRPVARRFVSLLSVPVLASGLLIAGVAMAPNAAAAPAPISEPGSKVVTADALPTVQIDGVVWSQAIVGNTVYAGGDFSHARPAGSAAGQNQSTRTDLVAYSLSTGVMTSFAPTLNGQVKTVVASPDGSRIYVGGQFTTINGSSRSRIAAFSTATGALVSTFAPPVNFTVNAIVATNTTVYAGGAFSAVGSSARSRLAAFSASTGALLGWSPSADATVTAMVMTPSGSKVIVGGAFQHINAGSAYGLGAVDPNSGALVSWAANTVVRDAGQNAAINSLSTDGTAIYGSGYVFGSGGNLEGAFSANPETGNINWIEDCHGDTYGVFGVNGIVYTVSHAHYCGNVGGFPQTDPWTMHRGLAWTANAVGTVAHNAVGGYFDWFGRPAPSLYNWFPDLDAGTFTGVGQAAWQISGNGQYVVMGGEFPRVNNTPQQGLVRFAVRPIAPGTQAPRVSVVPALTALSNTSVRVTWQTSWDRDNQNLTYRVIRNDNVASPVFTTTATSQFWNRPNLTFTDNGLASGTHYNYKVYVSDPFGNTLQGANVGITTGGAPGNQPPVAAFTQGCTNLTCSFSGSSSFDPNGSISGYAWNFGDGATATGVAPSHTYGSAGTRTVTLTVTDNGGATNSTSHPVTVPASGVVAADSFSRTTSNGWGSADTGGAYTVAGVPSGNFSVSSGAGRMTIPSGGSLPTAYLNGASAADSDSVVDVTFDKAPTASNYQYAYIAARHSGNSLYRLRMKILGTGVIQLSVTKVSAGTETVLATQTISGLTFTPGQYLRMRLRVTGTIPVSLSGKLWAVGSAEPGTWQVTASDASNTVGPGGPGLAAYLIAGAPNAPVVALFRNFTVGPPAGP